VIGVLGQEQEDDKGSAALFPTRLTPSRSNFLLPITSPISQISPDPHDVYPCQHCLHAYNTGGLARFLAYELQPTSVLEFGCGVGLYIDYLCRKRPLQRAWGVEPESMLFDGSVFHSVSKLDACPAQLTSNIFSMEDSDLEKWGQFDLVYSIEVAEHLQQQQHSRLARFLAARTAKWLVFSAAHPGQASQPFFTNFNINFLNRHLRPSLYSCVVCTTVRMAINPYTLC